MRRMAFVGPAMGLLLAIGCRGPLRIATFNRIGFDGPLQTASRVNVEVSPTSDGGKLQSVTVADDNGNARCAKIALLDVDGLLLNDDLVGPYSLGENPVSLFREKLDALRTDRSIKAVVLRINSPGGSVTASDIMRRDLKAYKEQSGVPIVACVMDYGASGAYYLASAADAVIAHPTSVVGGIGVVLNLYNLKDVMATFNVVRQEIKAGPNIDIGAPNRELPREIKLQLQAIADDLHERFKQAVVQARPKAAFADATTFDGRVFGATEARRRGLIDDVGYLDDAIVLARKLCNVEQAPIAMFRRSNDQARSLYAITPNVPLQGAWSLASVPGLERTRLPAFLYLWQPESTLEKLGGK